MDRQVEKDRTVMERETGRDSEREKEREEEWRKMNNRS